VRSRFRILSIVLLCGMVACQPVPQPFSHVETGRTAPLDLPDSAGIVVLDVADAPPSTSAALSRAMAAALAERNVPATTRSGNRQSHFLQGAIEDDGRDAAIVWSLYDADGDLVDSVRQSIEGTPVDAWARADAALMANLAKQSAPHIAALVQSGVPVENTTPALFVADVSGAPGQGNQQLQSALRRHLSAAGLVLSAHPTADTLTVTGTVEVGPVTGDRQQATLEWRVIDGKQVEVGKIRQSNPVAAGSLDGSWGQVADIAAQGAAEGINNLVRRIDWIDRDSEKSAAESGPSAPENARR
jgi:hypothetical protein